MKLVVDASAVAAWLMPDEIGVDLVRLRERGDQLIAPWLLWVELRNLLLMAIRRNRISPDMAARVLASADALGVALDTNPNSTILMDHAGRYRLTAYDALYLELAKREAAGLLSADKALCHAARQERVTVLDWNGL
ncbi:type II toxin-antitoxin system VapC family toxin [Neogemmobacter tilapiae]|uniref:Ribonuclease VapC n=1 Tax=Neogemmobacter tilapiae TaxID=875041 RepID=A0A918TLR2_9RHOB|nr:type II toxin-antitoxin system VapC family toxin [Gemmobacter tilapiae]GHC53521.1 ribonuclease VapC [Gemmobacter tilapiae]